MIVFYANQKTVVNFCKYVLILFDNTFVWYYNTNCNQKGCNYKGKKMKLSSKTHYGLNACYILAKNYPDNSISASALESQISVSGKYLEKIMRMLSARGIVAANRGANGGYYLARAPKEITVGEIVRTLEDDMEIIECVKNDGKCKCCPTSSVWKRLYAGINNLLDQMNLEQMINGEIR